MNESFFTIYVESIEWFGSDAPISSPVSVDYIAKTFSYINPTFSGSYATYTSTGYFSGKFNTYGDVTSGALDLKNLTATTKPTYEFGNGVITLTGSIKGSVKNNIETDTYTITKASYVGNDGSWSIGGSLKYTYKEDYNSGNITEVASGYFNSISSSDNRGNSILMSGKFTYDASIDSFTGYMTTLKVTVGSTVLNVTKLKITIDDWSNSELTTF